MPVWALIVRVLSGADPKARTFDDIDRFGNDVARSEARVTERQADVEALHAETDESRNWSQQHDWRNDRLQAVEGELADVHGYLSLVDLNLDDLIPDQGGLRRTGWERNVGRDAFISRTDRAADVASPPLPGHDAGLGIDFGL